MPDERHIFGLARVGLTLAALFIFIVGAIFRVEQMFLMALTLVLLPAVAWIIGRCRARKIACRRQLPALCAAGEVVSVTLFVTNLSRLAQPSVCLTDMLPRPLRIQGTDGLLLLDVRPGESREAIYQVIPARRGRFQLGPVQVETGDPIGFYSFVQKTGEVSELAVYPQSLPLRRVFWELSSGAGMQGLDSTQRRGAGMEFQGVRAYQSGDELRHVHWRTTARTGALSVAEYALGTSVDTELVLDLSRRAYAGGNDDDLLETAVTLVASLCAFLLRRGDHVRLTLPSEAETDEERPTCGVLALPRLLARLVDVTATSPLTLPQALHRMPFRQASGNLVLVTPFADDPQLEEVLVEQTQQGRLVFGFALHAQNNPGTSLPRNRHGQWRTACPGEDLIKVMEG